MRRILPFYSLLLAFGLFQTTPILGQTLNWVGSIETTVNNARCETVALSNTGDIYVGGNFRGNADFDLGAGNTTLSSVDNTDAFLSKYDANGNFIFAFAIGSNSTSVAEITRIYDVAVDGNDDVIIVGEFRGTNVNFAPLGGTPVTMTSSTGASNSDGFIAKYNSNGQCIWAMQFGAGSNSNELFGVAVDAANNIYMAGRLDDNGTAGLNLNPRGTAVIAPTNGADAVLIKYDSDGFHQWNTGVSGASNSIQAYNIAVLGNRVYLVGEFQGTANFNALGTAISRTSAGSYDGYVVQYDATTGIANWVNQMGSTGSDEWRELAVDAAGSVYVTGLFNNTIDLDPSGATANITSTGSTDIAVAKYTTTGAFSWGFGMGNTSLDDGQGVAVDGSAVYITGRFRNTMDVDPSAAVVNLVAQGSNRDAGFVAKYQTTTGTFASAFAITGPNTEQGRSITARSGSLYLVGYFDSPTVDFDPVGTTNRTNSSGTDYGFVARYDDVPSLETIAVTEWLTNPSGTESQEEWIELYNFGASPVNLRDWRLRDADTDNAVISSTDLFLAPDSYLILARNKASFEQLWLAGCPSSAVVEVSMVLANGADEIILENASGTVVWELAYANDETEGRATFYTENTYNTRAFGTKASPGVVRAGNDVTTSLGYQKNNITTDPEAVTNLSGDVGSPAVGVRITPERGNVVQFDGIDDYIDVGAMPSLENTSTFSIEFWVKPLSIDVNSERIFSKRVNNNNRIEITLGNGAAEADRQRLRVNICNGVNETYNSPVQSVPLNEWTHVAVVFDGSQTTANRLKVLINGIQQTNAFNLTATTTHTGANVEFGRRTGGNRPSNIELDELRVWSTALSNTAVRENMHLSLTGCETGLLRYYQFNETTGTTTIEALGSATATLMNGVARPASGVNVGRAVDALSVSQAAVLTGVQNFGAANLSMDVTSHSAAEDITVTYQTFAPNSLAGLAGISIIQVPMWTVNRSLGTASITGNYTFILPVGTLTTAVASNYELFHRPMGAEGTWTSLGLASGITANSLTFNNIAVTGQFILVQTSNSLPVEWLYVTAERLNANQVALNWATASETNNQGFSIERRLDNETEFQTIAWVDGKGNSVQTNYYTLEDKNSYLGTSYYRILQVDFDGTSTYSETKAVEGIPTENYIDYSIQPNPTAGELYISFGQLPPSIQQIDLRLYSLLGQELYQEVQEVKADQVWQLESFADLPAGTYLLQMTANNGVILQQKVIKR